MKNINEKFKKLVFLILFIFSLFHLDYQFNLSAYLPENYTEKKHLVQQVHAEEKQNESTNPEIFSPNPDYIQEQWNLNLMNIGEAWADGYTGQGIKIAILDTGFHHRHPDISMAGGYSVFSDDPWSYDHSGHGTHIAGIISAKRDTTYQGVAPDAEVYGIKIYHSEDITESNDVSTDVNSVIKGIRQAIIMDSDIIVISSGLNYHDEDLYDIIKEAYDKEIMIIAASGNGNTTVNYPAHYDEVIAVTAVDEELNPALDIIYGHENEFSAPGVNIGGLSIPDSSYSYPYIFMSGSSQATPHAAGIAAIFMQKYDAKGEKIRKIMQDQAVNIGEDGLFGHGLLYYQADEAPVNDLPDQEIEPKTEEKRQKETSDIVEDSEVRKPVSSREADEEEDEEEELLNYRQVVITFNEDGVGKLSGNVLSQIEVGGTLELLMDKGDSLKLSENQVAEIRNKNISLVLSKKNVSWKIPPSNFVSGQTILRFYEGKPLGTIDSENSYTDVHTISIFQTGTRQGRYPSEMEVRFDLNNPEISDLTEFEAAYFDKTELEWVPLDKEINDDTLTLTTKHTGAIGFFNPKETVEKVVLENIDDNSNPLFLKIGITIISLVLVFIAIKLILNNKKKD